MKSNDHFKALFGKIEVLFERFLRRFITVNETWIHHYTPEIKEQPKQWISPDERAPKKAKTVPSARKGQSKCF